MISVRVVTPNGEVLEQHCDFVTASGDEGQVGILRNHMPLIMKISKGYIKLVKDKEVTYVALVNGVFENFQNHINVIAQDASVGSSYEEAEELRVEALKARSDENKRLLVDFVEAERELAKSIREASQYKV